MSDNGKIENIDYVLIDIENISEKFITNNGKESLLILTLLSRNITIRKEIVFNFKYLFDILKIPLNRKERKDKITQSISKMFNIKFAPDVNINKMIYIPYSEPKENSLIISDESVNDILNYNKRVDKFNLFNVYLVIKKYLSLYHDMSHLTIEDIMYETNINSNNTVLKYFKILDELEFIEYKGKYKWNPNTERIQKSQIKTKGNDCIGESGVYFIYDEDDKIAYIGKSTACVVDRSIKSAEERNLFNFSKIEIRPIKIQSDVEIYEKYYIQKYKPYCNVEGVFDDYSSIELPKLPVRQILYNSKQ